MIRDDYGTSNGWRAVTAGAMGCAVGAGVVAVYAFGIFLKPITAEFGWPRSVVSTAMALFYFASGLGSLGLGAVIGRWGVRWPTAIGAGLFGGALCLFTLIPNSVAAFWLLFVVLGVFGSTATAQPYAVMICSWFDRRRGLALALAVAGTGLGSSTMALYANALLERFGWRGGYLGIGLLVAVVSIVATLVIMPRLRTEPPVAAAPDAPQMRLIDIWRDRAFWLIGMPILLFSVAISMVLPFLVPIVTDRGMSPAAAAGLMSISGICSWVGRLSAGIILDRVAAPKLMALIFVCAAVAVGIVALNVAGWPLFVAAGLLGVLVGTEADVVAFTVSRYFPPHAYARALGAVWICWAWGGGLGTLLAGAVYGLFGTYSAGTLPAAALALLAAFLVLWLGPYRHSPAGHGAAEA